MGAAVADDVFWSHVFGSVVVVVADIPAVAVLRPVGNDDFGAAPADSFASFDLWPERFPDRLMFSTIAAFGGFAFDRQFTSTAR